MRNTLVLAAAAAMLAASALAAGEEVPFPVGYRSWTHIKSGWVGEGSPAYPRFAGMHHIYANKLAVEGYRTGTFPKGSVLVFDVLTTQSGPGSLTTGERRFRDVMQKSEAGWRFTEFNGESQTERSVTTDAGQTACGTCHMAAHVDHVFSKFADGG